MVKSKTKNMLLNIGIWLPLLALLVIHAIMITKGLPQEQVRVHAIVNTVLPVITGVSIFLKR